MAWLLLIGFAGYLYATRAFETVNGVRHFTANGRKEAMAKLRGVAVQVAPQAVAGGAAFVTVSPQALGASGLEAVATAEQNGGVVLLGEDFLDQPIGAVLVVTSLGSERAIATPDSGLAVLSVVPG